MVFTLHGCMLFPPWWRNSVPYMGILSAESKNIFNITRYTLLALNREYVGIRIFMRHTVQQIHKANNLGNTKGRSLLCQGVFYWTSWHNARRETNLIQEEVEIWWEMDLHRGGTERDKEREKKRWIKMQTEKENKYRSSDIYKSAWKSLLER